MLALPSRATLRSGLSGFEPHGLKLEGIDALEAGRQRTGSMRHAEVFNLHAAERVADTGFSRPIPERRDYLVDVVHGRMCHTLLMICSAMLLKTFTNIAVSSATTVMPCDSSFSGWM